MSSSANKKSMHDTYHKQGTSSSSNFNNMNSNYLSNSSSGKHLDNGGGGSSEQLFEDDEVERFDADTYKQKYGDRWKRLASSVRDIVQPDGTVIREYVIEDPGMLEQLSDNENDMSEEPSSSRNVPNVDNSNASSNNNSMTNTLRKQVAAAANTSGGGGAGQVYFYDEKTKSFTNMNFNQLTEKIHGTSVPIVSNNYDTYTPSEKFNDNYHGHENGKEAASLQHGKLNASSKVHEASSAKKSSQHKECSNESEKKQFANQKSKSGNNAMNYVNGQASTSSKSNNYDQYTIYNNNRKGRDHRDVEDEDKEVETIHEQGKNI